MSKKKKDKVKLSARLFGIKLEGPAPRKRDGGERPTSGLDAVKRMVANLGRFVVDLPLVDGENATITLHDLTGRQLLRTTVSEQRYEQTTELPAGIYLLTAELISGPVTRRVVVRQ